jgi:hypothetical protein
MNIIFDKVIELMNNLESVDTQNKFDIFEKEINNYIINIIGNKDNIEKINKDYQGLNNDLLSFDPTSMKEIIQANFDPSIYDQKIYPDIQYYSVSEIVDFNTFVNKFNSSEENKKKYALINMLINKDTEVMKNALNMKYLISINKLTNLLLNIYSYKISRDEAKDKNKTLKEEIPYIINAYNEMSTKRINDNNEFIDEYINPFIQSWNGIKKNSVQYKCRVLKDLEKGEKPYEINIDNRICDFLVDDGDKEGGMYLAAAYEYLIRSQNTFINDIISKNNIHGILNSYIGQLEQSINIQDATKNEIIIIDDKIFEFLDDLILSNSMRNIFDNKKNEINYKNYNDIIFNFDIIEEELGKKILPGLKKFNNDKIKFVTYLYEGFRGNKSSVLLDYNNKYNPIDLDDSEKKALSELLEENNNTRFYNDVFASLQILMNEIIKENYPQNYLLYKVIESKPNYIILNAQLVEFLKKQYEYYESESFTIQKLMGIFDYFEALCWKEIEKKVPVDYQLELEEEFKTYLKTYFEKNINEKKIINKDNLTSALRKLLSRYISGSKQESEIKNDAKLKYYITREDLWNKKTLETDGFENELDDIFKEVSSFEKKESKEIEVGQSQNLYKFLDGNNLLYDKLYKKKEKYDEYNNLGNNKKEDDLSKKTDLDNKINEISTKVNEDEDKDKDKDNNVARKNSKEEEEISEEESEEDSEESRDRGEL